MKKSKTNLMWVAVLVILCFYLGTTNANKTTSKEVADLPQGNIDMATLRFMDSIPAGEMVVRAVGENESVNHSIFMITPLKAEGGKTLAAYIDQEVKGNIDPVLEGRPIADHIPYCNITVGILGDKFVKFIPNHAVAFEGNLQRDMQKFMEMNDWKRPLNTDLLVNFNTTRVSYPHSTVDHIEKNVGQKVYLEGVQLGQESSYTNIVTANGILFKIPESLRKLEGNNLTESDLYGIKVTNSQFDFRGLSGSPVHCNNTVIGQLLGHMITTGKDKRDYAILLIHPLISPEADN